MTESGTALPFPIIENFADVEFLIGGNRPEYDICIIHADGRLHTISGHSITAINLQQFGSKT